MGKKNLELAIVVGRGHRGLFHTSFHKGLCLYGVRFHNGPSVSKEGGGERREGGGGGVYAGIGVHSLPYTGERSDKRREPLC